MTRRRSIAWILRITLLFLVFIGAWVLHRWHLRNDPRFYRFVETPSGRTLARVFSWHESRPPVPLIEKSEREMTVEELEVKRRLEADLKASLPTHRLEFKDGDEWMGHLMEEGPQHVVFRELYGESGSLSVRVPRSRIRSLTPLVVDPPLISYRDVRFRMEFPDLLFYKKAPYSIVTDESYLRVRSTVNALVRLYREFMTVFGELVTNTERGNDIQVLFFSRQEAYRSYQEAYAPHMPNSTGFYNAWVDRLVVFNQETAAHVVRARDWVEQAEATYREQYAGQPHVQQQIDDWSRQSEIEIARFAEVQTMNTIRHEGAHQLFFSLGVHSQHRIENEWVYEGLAVYCETGRLGEVDPGRVRVLREAGQRGQLILLEDIVNLRNPAGLSSMGHPRQVALAYAQAWSLVHFLMQGERRERFFDYLRHIRDPANFQEVRRASAMDLLCRFLETHPSELESAWVDYIVRM